MTGDSGAAANDITSLVPVVVGVTGHRDLRGEDVPALENAVRAVLQGLIDPGEVKAPETAETPWFHRVLAGTRPPRRHERQPVVVLSSLAEGADQLVARVALDLGARLWVPLPFPKDEYLKDFTPEGAREFERLLGQAELQFTVGARCGAGGAGDSRGRGRDFHYELASAWIVRRCHALLALWDGRGPMKPGGTAWTMGLHLGRDPTGQETSGTDGGASPAGPCDAPDAARFGRSPLDAGECGPVWHVVTPRRSRAAPPESPGTVKPAWPEGQSDIAKAERRFESVLGHIRDFNDEILRGHGDLGRRIAEKENALIPADELGGPGGSPQAIRLAARRYAVADAMALGHQYDRRRAVPWVFGAALAAVVCLETFAHIVPGNPWWLAGYLVAFLLGFLAIEIARHHVHAQKHIDYRALAEALRVHCFWTLAGSMQQVSDHHLRLHRTDLDWVREALRAWSAEPAGDERAGTTDSEREVAIETVRVRWVENQAKYFAKSAHQRHLRHDRCQRASNACLGLGFLVAAGMLVALLLAPGGSDAVAGEAAHATAAGHDAPHWVHACIVASGILLVTGGLARAFAEKMAYEFEARRYWLMHEIFSRANESLKRKKGPDGKVGRRTKNPLLLIEDLGREALAETAEWLLTQRDRRLEPHTGG